MYTHTHSAREEIEDENRRSTAEAGLDNKNFSDTVIELKCTVVGLLSSVVATVFFNVNSARTTVSLNLCRRRKPAK